MKHLKKYKIFESNTIDSSLVDDIIYSKKNIDDIDNDLDYAIETGKISANTKVNNTSLLIYVLFHKPKINILPIIERLSKDEIDFIDEDGDTALHIVTYNNDENLDLILEFNPDWNIENSVGDTYLDMLKRNDIKKYEEVIENYPEKYQEYIKWKKIKEFNL